MSRNNIILINNNIEAPTGVWREKRYILLLLVVSHYNIFIYKASKESRRFSPQTVLFVADLKVNIPRFSKKSWMAFPALRGAYKHVQVNVNFSFEQKKKKKNRFIGLPHQATHTHTTTPYKQKISDFSFHTNEYTHFFSGQYDQIISIFDA